MSSDSDDDEFSEFRVQSDLFPSRSQSLTGSPAKQKQAATMAAKPQLANRQEIQGLQAQWQKDNTLANGSLGNSLFASSSPQSGTKRQRPNEGGGQEGSRSSSKRRRAADENLGGSSDRPDASALYSSAGVPFPSSAPPSASRPSASSGAGLKGFVLRESAASSSSATSTPTARRTVVAPTAPVIRAPRTAGNNTPSKMNSTPTARPKPFNSGLDLAAPVISCSSGSEDEIPTVPAALRERVTTQSRGTPGTTEAQRSAKSTSGKPAAPSYPVPATITPVPIPRPFGAAPPRTLAVASPTTSTPEAKPTNLIATRSKKLYALWISKLDTALKTFPSFFLFLFFSFFFFFSFLIP